MNELIEEAEKLYKEIDSIQMILIASTKDNNKQDKIHAIGRMSIAMCNAMQLLKCFIERKDNIVDLSEVWKDDSHIPQTDKKVVVINNNGTFINGYLYIDERTFTVKTDSYRIIISDRSDLYRWAYLNDLLPKGGE